MIEHCPACLSRVARPRQSRRFLDLPIGSTDGAFFLARNRAEDPDPTFTLLSA
ncbi:hypothetical protein AB5I41_06350 [Sphingomonas sp. MMS24-JH45]